MLARFRQLPLTLRLPLVVAVMIFVTAIGTTQTALNTVARQFESQMGRIGQVYLDGVSAALLPVLQEADRQAMTRVLEQALQVSAGVEDRRLVLLNKTGDAIAEAQREHLPPIELPELGSAASGARMDNDGETVWVWRTLEGAHRIIANLDATAFSTEMMQMRGSLLVIDILVSAACALLGFLVARQIQRPIALIAHHLQTRAGQPAAPLPQEMMAVSDPDTVRLIGAVNEMAAHTQDREAMLTRMAEQEREAVLGRLAATLAHEVRNPLGGMDAAIQTLRKFGDRPEVRQDALEFMERGVHALRGVVDATLQTHRPHESERPLRLQDLHDVHRLTAADAQRRGVQVRVEIAPGLPAEVSVSATEVRQILLNLLLNAVRATAPGGWVILRASERTQALVLEVIDQGPGMAEEIAESLVHGEVSPSQAGLGVAVIVRLVQQLHGQVAVEARSQGGTHITLTLPLEKASEMT